MNERGVPVANKADPSGISGWTTNNRKRLESLTTDENKSGDVFKVRVYENDIRQMVVYNVPVEAVSYNFDNVRISAEKIKKERDLGRRLDPSNTDDQKLVGDILYTSKFYDKNVTEDLEKDIEDNGQDDPAVVSIDGVVWNGNRRLSIRRKLLEKTGKQEYTRVPIVVLPEMSSKDLKRLERRLQMRRDWKVDFGPIHTRLDVRNSLDTEDWPIKELIESYGKRYSESKLRQFKGEIDLIDEYLKRIHRENDYVFIEEKDKKGDGGTGIESFTSLYDIIETAKRNEVDDLEIEKIKLAGFRLIHHPKTTYNDLRRFSNNMADPESKKEFMANSTTFKKFNEITRSGEEFDPESVREEYKNNETAYAIIQDRKTDPKELALKALRSLENISDEKIPKNNRDFRDIIDRLETRISELQSKYG